MVHLILCGGHGIRLWPLSNEDCPKSFFCFGHRPSMFQQTIQRNQPFSEKTLVVANERHAVLALRQSDDFLNNSFEFLFESSARDTAAAIALACFGLPPDEIVLVTPSDHWVEQQEEYEKTVQRAVEIAKEDYIAAIGVRPTRPYEGYGYIRAEGEDVVYFHEKPNPDQAQIFLQERGWFWNSGIYCFKASVLLEELRIHSPSIWATSKIVHKKRIARTSNEFSYPNMDYIQAESIDIAVMQKSNRLKMVLLQTGWSDIGTLEELAEFYQTSSERGARKPEIIQFQSNNNVVLSSGMPVALIDVEDLIIAATNDGILISKRGSSHKVKLLMITNIGHHDRKHL